MENVISFQKAKKKKEIEEQLYQRKDRIKTARTSIKEYWENIEKEEEEWFKERFSERYSENILVIDSIPYAAKMQHLAASMLKLVPDIFHHNNWITQYDTWLYFYELYILEFYPIWNDYIDENKDFEKPYPYKFKPMTKNKLEEDLKDCLTKLIELYPERYDEDKTSIMYQSARLFEIDEILFDLFYKELIEQ